MSTSFKRPIGMVLAALFLGGAAMAQVATITPIEVPGSRSVVVTALNAAGNVAGYFTAASGAERPFFWNGVATDQGTLGGRDGQALDLNGLNQTTGYAYAVGDVDFRAFLGIDRTLTDLGTLGGASSLGFAINDRGDVTGYSFVSLNSATFHAFISRQGVMTDLGTLGGSASSGTDINELGQVTGDSNLAGDFDSRAFFFDGTAVHDIGALGGGFSSAYDLNNAGQVTGVASTTDEAEYHAFLYGGGVIQDLGTLGGPFSIGYVINDAGSVAGDSSLPGDEVVQGFVWRNGAMTSVGHLGGQHSSVWGLNNANQVVGVSTNGQGLGRAFLWQDGAILDLNSTLRPDSGWVLEVAHYINDAGQIVGTGRFQGAPSWFRLALERNVNQPPVARAGEDVLVNCGDAARLDGSGSSDPDGDALAFAWFEGDQLLGETARLSVRLEPGVHSLRLRVSDSNGASDEDEVVVTVADTTPPRVELPGHVTRAAGRQCSAEVPDLLANVRAVDNCTPRDQLVITQEPAPGTAMGLGEHEITVRVVDAAGNATVKAVTLRVVDRTAPTIVSLSATPNLIQPANNKMVPVRLSVVSADNCDPNPVSRILRVESSDPVTSEPANGPVDRTAPDWKITGPLTLEVRAEVVAPKVRVYTVVVMSQDNSGNSSTGRVEVTVKRNKHSGAEEAVAPAKAKAKVKAKVKAKD